jgi:hypothetical protein
LSRFLKETLLTSLEMHVGDVWQVLLDALEEDFLRQSGGQQSHCDLHRDD